MFKNIIRRLLILLGLVKVYKPYDLWLMQHNPDKFYKILKQLSFDKLPLDEIYPMEGNKRLKLDEIIVKASKDKSEIEVYLDYVPREANINKYKAVDESSYIEIQFKIINGEFVYHTNIDETYGLNHIFKYFTCDFYDKFLINITTLDTYLDDHQVINLDGLGDILVLYNKIASFKDLDRDETKFACINGFDIEPIIPYEHEDIKITSYYGISQFNLKVDINDGIGNRIVVKSYHQDNKLKIKVKECINRFKIDIIKLHNTIEDIAYMLDENSRKLLNLDYNINYNENYIYVYSNNTRIIEFRNEDDFNSFIDGAKESFLRIIKTGICVVKYDEELYTCFKGVANNGIIEYIAISGDTRIQTTAMKYDPIRLRNEYATN